MSKFIKSFWIVLVLILLLISIIIYAKGISIPIFKHCDDGTFYSECSKDKPLYCSDGALIKNASYCGCLYKYKPNGDECEKIPICNDGTFYSECSKDKPLYCFNGILLSKASLCGCPEELVNENEICISKYKTGAKQQNFSYMFGGNKSSFSWEVYQGLDEYLLSLSKEIYYESGQTVPTSEDFLIKNINESEQREFLLPLVEKIKSLSNDSDDQARIAISIVQNIPYDEEAFRSLNLEDRYAYEVLYDNKGVCGEKSALLVFLLRELGYGTALIDFEDIQHQAVGISCPSDYSYKSTGYCFVETSNPSIITDDQGGYPSSSCPYLACAQKLPENYKLTVINEGSYFRSAKQEYDDARKLIALDKKGSENSNYLEQKDYYEWWKLINKYGIQAQVI